METALFTDAATSLMTVVVVLAFTCMSYFATEIRKPMNNAWIRRAGTLWIDIKGEICGVAAIWTYIRLGHESGDGHVGIVL